MIFWLSYYILKFIALVYFRGRVEGRENLPVRGPYIGVFNHSSFVDVAAATLVITSRVTTMAKHSLFEIPVLRWWLRAVGLFPVIRDSGDEQAFNQALAHLKHNGIFFIAAEGTRHHDHGAPRPRTGFVRLAQMMKCPVVPVAFHGARQAMPPGAFFPRPVRLSAMIGKPIVLSPVECIPENKPLLQEQADVVMRMVYQMVEKMERREQAQRSSGDTTAKLASNPPGVCQQEKW